MKKTTIYIGLFLCFAIIANAAIADTPNIDQTGQLPMNGQMMQGQPPMGGPQMNGQPAGQMMQGQPPMGGPQMDSQPAGQMMQGQPPMNLAVLNTDTAESISLLSDADSSAEILGTIESGSIVEILEEDGDYVKINANGMIGYVLSSVLSEMRPVDGQEPPAKPEDGKESPAKPEDGKEPPAKPEDGKEPPAKPEDGQEPPAKPEDGMEPPTKPEDGKEPQESLEPGLHNFFKAFFNFLTGKNVNNQ